MLSCSGVVITAFLGTPRNVTLIVRVKVLVGATVLLFVSTLVNVMFIVTFLGIPRKAIVNINKKEPVFVAFGPGLKRS